MTADDVAAGPMTYRSYRVGGRGCPLCPQPAPLGRGTALSPTEMLRLDQWAESLTWVCDPGPYLVGSVLSRRDYRDVDVRVRLDDDDPYMLDAAVVGDHLDRLRLVNVAMSVWAQQVCGLPVDFQFQRASEWDAEDGPRDPLGGRWRTVHSRGDRR